MFYLCIELMGEVKFFQANFLIDDGNLTNKERLTIVRDIVEELINISKLSLMPPSLQLIIKSLSAITETLENINSTDMVSRPTLAK
jgi:hypothetical protein